ncbi:MAG: sugar phosphate isomerase/epimerase [Planctomycetes bacterium]|nr:sugar phosphate isomerase/epimerase [Planctomycetota bacterium]
MLPGYNTNGFAHHRLDDAVDILAGLGYRSIALTLDFQAILPGDPPARLEALRSRLDRHGLGAVIETGARFVLDPRRKHQPTLLDPDPAMRGARRRFLEDSIGIGRALGSGAISFWSGAAPPGESGETLMDRLAGECLRLADHAADRGQRLAFEPEPGMFIDTMARYAELASRVNHPAFGLTLDVGHLQCLGEVPVAPHALRWRDRLWNIHIEDMRRGVHDHLPFGEGEMDFSEVFSGLRAAGYQGGLHVELSRHSHDAVETARRSIAFLNSWVGA